MNGSRPNLMDPPSREGSRVPAPGGFDTLRARRARSTQGACLCTGNGGYTLCQMRRSVGPTQADVKQIDLVPPFSIRSNGMQTQVAIAGSGFGGLGTAIRLKQDGIEDFLILEKAGDVGGTWRDNSYPGCACDVESHLYSLSFAPNAEWTHRYSHQPEIWEYLQRCAREYALTPHLRFGTEVKSA